MSDSRTVTEWSNCYNDSWQGVIVPDAFAHPAKVAAGLAYRIYRHMIDQGYIAPGDHIVDPFGGIGGFAYHAILLGLHWHGIELEPRFVELGQRNIDKWQRDLAMLNGTLGTARLVQGDSRRLLEVVGGGMAAAVSSPPYSTEALGHSRGENGAAKERELGIANDTSYGSTPGQLGSMPPGSFDSAVSSPPYSDMIDGQGEGPGARYDPIYHNGDNAYKQSSANGYGTTPGNLGSMAGEGFEAAVSSPPYEGQPVANYDGSMGDMWRETGQTPRQRSGGTLPAEQYNITNDANIANDTGDTFWAAARVIVEQTYTVLKPGGYAAWVTKRFIRKGQIVEFSEQWAQLCEAVGFVRVEWVRAMLTEEHGHQLDIFGESHPKGIKRASFFRRLYEKKYPENAIDWEDVIILRKPL